MNHNELQILITKAKSDLDELNIYLNWFVDFLMIIDYFLTLIFFISFLIKT